MFEDFKKFETEIAGRPFVVEVGKMAQLAGGSCLVRYGRALYRNHGCKAERGRGFLPAFS